HPLPQILVRRRGLVGGVRDAGQQVITLGQCHTTDHVIGDSLLHYAATGMESLGLVTIVSTDQRATVRARKRAGASGEREVNRREPSPRRTRYPRRRSKIRHADWK